MPPPDRVRRSVGTKTDFPPGSPRDGSDTNVMLDSVSARRDDLTTARVRVYPTFRTNIFPDFYRAMARAFNAVGVEVRVDDLDHLGAFLLSGPRSLPGANAEGQVRPVRRLVIDRSLHVQAGLAVHLYFHMLAHVLLGDVDEANQRVVEPRSYGTLVEGQTEEEIESHRRADARALELLDACVEGVGQDVAGRLASLGVTTSDQIASVCSVLPGSRRHLRSFLRDLKHSRWRPMMLRGLTLFRELYDHAPVIRKVLAPDSPVVSYFRDLAIAAEIREFVHPPDDRAIGDSAA